MTRKEILSKSFVVASADLPLYKVLQMIAKVRAKYLILNRIVGGDEYHYVFLITALKAGLKQFRFERSIPLEIALNLHEYQRDRVVEVQGPPSDWILPSVDREARSGPFMLKDADR